MPDVSSEGPLKVACPDCGCDLTIDAVTGKVLFHKSVRRKPAQGKDFDQLLSSLDEAKDRADEVFRREVSALKDRDRLMEETFREALRQAREEPDDEPPPSPWDLD